jgi:hypothetical protein
MRNLVSAYSQARPKGSVLAPCELSRVTGSPSCVV